MNETMTVNMHDVKLIPFRFKRGIKLHTSINVAGAGVNRAEWRAVHGGQKPRSFERKPGMLENSQVSEGKLRLLHYAICCTQSEASLRDAKKGLCGGKAIIAGIRIPVWSIAGGSRYSAEKIQKDIYPRFGIAEIYDALSYSHDHGEEIDQQLEESSLSA